jgi:uncharacterized protein
MFTKPYRDFNSYLRELYGCRVQKISLDAGLTCPNRDGSLGFGGCIYCNSRGSGTGASEHTPSIADQVRAAKSYLGKRYKANKFLAYFQSFTNTYAPLSVLKKIYEDALADPDIVGLAIGTRPDCVPDAVLDYLQELSQGRLIIMEFGLQSANDATLLRIGRGHTVEAFVDAVQRARSRGLFVCAHVILGLPGENHEDMMRTAHFVASMDIQAIKIHLLYVIRGTALDLSYQRNEYKCLSREEYVEAVGEFLTLLPPYIIIQRLTGDPHRQELVAPLWAMEKQKNLDAIHRHMLDRGLYQGQAWWGGLRRMRHEV